MATTRVECPSCGTDQEVSASPGRAPRCSICGAAMGAGSDPAPRRASGSGVSLPSAAVDVHAVEAVSDVEADEHLARLSEARADPSAEVERLLAFEKRSTSILALVPLWGPARIWSSEVHGTGEKIVWSVLSLALTAALATGVWALLPGAAEEQASLEARVDSDLEALSGLVVRYRERYGSFPDPATWENSAGRGDSRFYDPWGRAYLFRESGAGFALGTLGRDGVLGGDGADADRFADFEP